MAKAVKRSKAAARPSFLADPAVRATGIRVGVAALVLGVGGALALYETQRDRRVSLAGRPQPVAAAPALRQAAALTPAPAPAPSLTPTPLRAAAVDEPAPSAAPTRREGDNFKPMPSALRASFDAWLMGTYAKCWRAPKKQPDGEAYAPKVRVAFREDGTLSGAPKLVNPPSDPAWKPHAEAALKAVKGCDIHVPDKYAEYYPSWKSKTVYFDPAKN